MKPTRRSNVTGFSNAPQASGSAPEEAPFSENYYAEDRVELNVGSGAEGFQIARMTRVNLDAQGDIGIADYIAHCVQVRCDYDLTASSPLARGVYAVNTAVWLQDGAKVNAVVGINPQVVVDEGAEFRQRIGVRAQVDGAATQGSVLDAAYTAYSSGDAAWKNLIALNEETCNAQSIAEDGNFCTAPEAMTLGNVFDCENVTVTGYILNFPNFKVTGSGDVIANSITSGGGNYTSANVALASGITLTNVTTDTLTYIDLDPGDYDVSWQACFQPTGNCTLQQVASSASLSEDTIESDHDKCQVMHWGSAGITLSSGNAIRSGLGNARFTSEDPMRVYLNGLAQFPSGSGCKFSGKIWARRIG